MTTPSENSEDQRKRDQVAQPPAGEQYDSEYYDARGTSRIKANPFDRKHFDRVTRKLGQTFALQPQMSVLDLGCGYGYLSYHFAERCARAVGVDISPTAVEFARKTYARPNLAFEVGDILSWNPQEKFDLVLFVSLYEHLTREQADLALERFKGWLKPGGVVAVHTITAKTWMGRRRTREKGLGTIDFSGDTTHTCIFTPGELKEHFESHGYALRGEYVRLGSYLFRGETLKKIFRFLHLPAKWRDAFVIEALFSFGLGGTTG
ncbi:MAG: methyltransferase domain-containing protein [Planctomycetota bacterium]|nr:methyltransferase domain-containing protein [Planctomycetota bacterium]